MNRASAPTKFRPELVALGIYCGLCLCANANAQGIGDDREDVQVVADVSFLGDDRNEKLDLYFPPGKPQGRRPAVVVIHGGGWHGGDKAAKREQNIGHHLAAAGYVCASINYRLCKKSDDLAARLREVWPGNLHDCKTAVRFLRRNADEYSIDPDHIGAIGGSAGGHLVAMLATTSAQDGLDPTGPYGEHSCRIQAVVPMYGVHDILAHAREKGSPLQDSDQALGRQASPVTWVTSGDPPALILHGTKDALVAVEQSRLLHERLAAADVPSQLIVIDEAPHSFHLQPKQRDLRPAVIAFFDQHLKPAIKVTKGSRSDRPFMGAYVNLGRIFNGARGVPEREQAITHALDRFQASGLYVVMPYVTTTSGAANYPSKVIATQIYGDWDPLAYLIKQAKQRGLQVYPVFCVLACGHEEPDGVLKQHPDWAVRNPAGQPLGYICPANAKARGWVTSAIEEVVRSSAIDGILLDYLRYPNRPMRLDAASEAEFKRHRQEHGDRPEAELLQAFRESGLTALARQISGVARRHRPDSKIAIYSWGPHVASNHRVAQPWPEWSREGLIDMVNISGYCYRKNYGEKYLDVFGRRIGDAVRLNQSHDGQAEITFCLGVATSHGKISASREVEDYLRLGVKEKVKGVAVFTWSTLDPFLDEVNQAAYFTTFREQLNK